MGAYRLEELIDIGRFQVLQDRLNRICPFPSAIVDNEGRVLTATAWQDVCTKFHRAHPETAAACVESDRYILGRLHEADPAVSYRCPHGLIDNAAPIVIEGVHYGSFFTGQFFLEPPDLSFFREQARRYGFDEPAYLAAVGRVPVWSGGQLHDYVHFIRELIAVISAAGLRKLREIEARRRIEASGNLVSGILNSVPQSIFWKDPAGVYLGCNEAFAKAVGLERPELIVGKTDFDLPWPRSEAEAYRADDREVLAAMRPKRHIIEPLQQADGRRLWIDTSKVPLSDAAGDPWGVLGVYDDVTERRRAESELRERQRQLAESQRIAHVGSWEHNLRTGEVFWSEELFRLLGLDPAREAADFRVFFAMVHPDDQPALRRAIDTTLRERIPFDIEYRFVLRDGTQRVIHAQAELRADDAGDPVVLGGTAQDITARKDAEERVRQGEEFVRGILDTVDEGFIVVDPGYRIVTANSAYCAQAGLPVGDVVGRRCHEVSHGSDRPCHERGEGCAVREVFASGERRTALHRHRGALGEPLFVETKAYPIKDAAGTVTSVIETITNITERHLLEEERLKTQKLESIGTLAGGIAHDFNNLLQGIFGYIGMARLAVDRPERVEAMLGQAEEALRLAVGLTAQLLTFSKGGKPVRRTIRVRPVLENAAKFALSGSFAEYRLEVGPELWPVEADAGQLAQVVQNVVLNANEAMPAGGTVEIAARNVLLAAGELPGMPAGGRCVRITIRDTGVGIPERDRERIFDPYFTTKESGSGLGLATSYSIVRNHGGTMSVSSEVGRGSTFTIHLPAAEDADAGVDDDAPAEPPSSTRRGRILLMDDEDLVRTVGREMLAALGHEVDCAADGAEAIEVFLRGREAGRPFDVVILDLTVRGGMGGAEAVGRLRELDPAVVAVVSSGYAENAVVADFPAYGFSDLLGKPYRLESLKECLDRLLVRR